MEKWRNEIEEILFKSQTVDRWLIRDLVYKEQGHAPMQLPTPSPLRKALMFLFMGPVFVPEAIWREEVKTLLTEAGLREESIDDLIDHAKRDTDHLPLWPGNMFKPSAGQDSREEPGDDE